MRTHILIATALILATTTAHAAPRSLSGAQSNPIEDVPRYTAQAAEQPKPAEQPQAVEQPAVTETKPVETAPVEQKPVAAPKVEAAPVAATPAPEGKSVKQAQRKPKHRQMSVEQHIHREFRNIERTIGFALSIPLAIPFYW